MSHTAAAVAIALGLCSLGWMDPHARAREAARLFEAGKYDDAAARYQEALVDDPDSALLHYNLGETQYRQKKYDEALRAFAAVPDADPVRAARVAYNAGNAKYRLGEAAAESNPQAALGLWAEALAAYRRAMGADPADVDAKFNHELVTRKIAELKKKLEEQQKKQDEQRQQQQGQQGDQNEQQGQQDKQDEGQQSGDENNQAKQQSEQQQQQQQATAPKDEPDASQTGKAKQAQQTQGEGDEQHDASAAAGERREGEMTPQEAAALLDAQRAQEVRPDEVTRRLQGAVVGEPAEDW